jgi:hypothetical protein
MRWLWGVVVIWSFLGRFGFIIYLFYWRYGFRSGARAAAYVSLFLGIGIICDIIYVAATRWMLLRVIRSTTIAGTVIAVGVNLVLIFFLLAGPMMIAMRLPSRFAALGAAIMFSFVLNAIDLIVCLVALCLAVIALIHRALWPALERPVYACARYGVIRRKALLWAVGIGLLAVPGKIGAGVWTYFLSKLR